MNIQGVSTVRALCVHGLKTRGRCESDLEETFTTATAPYYVPFIWSGNRSQEMFYFILA